MLFLHGYGADGRSFFYQTTYFSQTYRVTAPDFPGFGQSAPLPWAWSVTDYADWLQAFVCAARLERPVVVAHSFGARVAFKWLSRGGECEKLIVTGGAGLVKRHTDAYYRKVRIYRMTKAVFPRWAETHFGSREYRLLSPLMKESYKKIVNEDLSDDAQKVVCPTLLIYGREDTVTPPDEEGETFRSLIETSRLTHMEGGHFCFCEHPQAFNALAESFLVNR